MHYFSREARSYVLARIMTFVFTKMRENPEHINQILNIDARSGLFEQLVVRDHDVDRHFFAWLLDCFEDQFELSLGGEPTKVTLSRTMSEWADLILATQRLRATAN